MSQSNDKVETFLKRYGELVEELDVDFANYPMFVPDGGGGFRIIIQTTPVDLSERGVKSPFIADDSKN